MKAKVLELKNQLKEEVKNIFQQELPSLTSYFADLLEFTYNAITFFWDASNNSPHHSLTHSHRYTRIDAMALRNRAPLAANS